MAGCLQLQWFKITVTNVPTSVGASWPCHLKTETVPLVETLRYYYVVSDDWQNPTTKQVFVSYCRQSFKKWLRRRETDLVTSCMRSPQTTACNELRNTKLIYVQWKWPTAKQGRFVSFVTAVDTILYRAKISSCITLLKRMGVVELTSTHSWSVYINIAIL
jgi:hypothetical protein